MAVVVDDDGRSLGRFVLRSGGVHAPNERAGLASSARLLLNSGGSAGEEGPDVTAAECSSLDGPRASGSDGSRVSEWL